MIYSYNKSWELERKGILPNIVETVKQFNTTNTTKLKIKVLTTPQQIQLNAGVRQGDSLNSWLFNPITDRIIEKVCEESRG